MNAIVKIDPRTDNYLIQYEQAVRCLQLCKESLSLEGLTPIDITIEALRARAKIMQDRRAKQAAYELEIEKARAAAHIANEIVKRDKPTYGKRAEPLSAIGVLQRAGWDQDAAAHTVRIGKANGIEIARVKQLAPTTSVHKIARRFPPLQPPRNRKGNPASPAYVGFMRRSGLNESRARLKELAVSLYASDMAHHERFAVVRAIVEIRRWCDTALKELEAAP